MKNISIEVDEKEGKLEIDGNLEANIPFVSEIRSQIKEAAETTEGLVIFGSFSSKSLIDSAKEGNFTEDLLELGSSLLNPNEHIEF